MRTTTLRELRRELRDGEEPEPTLAERRDHLASRPKTRAECPVARPCPFVSCRYNLFLDVTPAGGIRVTHEGVALEELAETCALDLAELGGLTLEQVARVLGVTRQRIDQLVDRALVKLKREVDE